MDVLKVSADACLKRASWASFESQRQPWFKAAMVGYTVSWAVNDLFGCSGGRQGVVLGRVR